MSEPKILLWDIENTTLNATFGTVLCIGYKWHGQKKMYCPTAHDFEQTTVFDDRGLIEHFSEVYEQADYTVAHYGQRFDLPVVQTKRLQYDMGPLSPKTMIDTWRVMKDNFKFHSNRLQVAMEFLECGAQKTPIAMDMWKGAMTDKKCMAYVVKHCKADVLGLEEVFDKLRPWVRNEPARTLFVAGSGCVSCGSDRLHRRGFHTSRTRRYQRWCCLDCGKWQRSNVAEKDTRVGVIGGW